MPAAASPGTLDPWDPWDPWDLWDPWDPCRRRRRIERYFSRARRSPSPSFARRYARFNPFHTPTLPDLPDLRGNAAAGWSIVPLALRHPKLVVLCAYAASPEHIWLSSPGLPSSADTC